MRDDGRRHGYRLDRVARSQRRRRHGQHMSYVNVAGILYGPSSPVYATFAVEASFENGVTVATIRVIDDTRPIADAAGNALVQTISPGAWARKTELDAAGIDKDDYPGATLTFNGQSWLVESFEMRGSPQGENAGAVRFKLSAAP